MCDGGGELHQAFDSSAARFTQAKVHSQQMLQE